MFALKWSKYSYLFANELIKFKPKDSEIVATPLCLGNVSKDFPKDNTKKTGFYGYDYACRFHLTLHLPPHPASFFSFSKITCCMNLKSGYFS